MTENKKGEVSWRKKHHEIMSSIALIMGCFFFRGHSRVSLEIRKNDSPLNSSISARTKKREKFLIIIPNDVYNVFF